MDIKIHKADPLVSNEEIKGCTFSIDLPLPKTKCLKKAEELFHDDATQLFRAMKKNLPQGTRHRVAQLFLQDSVNLYRGR